MSAQVSAQAQAQGPERARAREPGQAPGLRAPAQGPALKAQGPVSCGSAHPSSVHSEAVTAWCAGPVPWSRAGSTCHSPSARGRRRTQRSGTVAGSGVACNDDVRVFINGQLRGVAAVACIVWFDDAVVVKNRFNS